MGDMEADIRTHHIHIVKWNGTDRYQCNCCYETFTEEIPFKYPGTRITYRAANWIKGFLQQKIVMNQYIKINPKTHD
ncbi:MAG: hypothetical protein EGR41_06575 [Ruminococcus sp.]|nr:hypothetical protein [Ruminococcus sp.]